MGASGRRNADTEEDKVRVKVKKLVLANLDSICMALVKKASEGNYSAASLLLQLGGIEPGAAKARDTGAQDDVPRMFLLEVLEKLLSEAAPAEGVGDILSPGAAARPRDSSGEPKSKGTE